MAVHSSQTEDVSAVRLFADACLKHGWLSGKTGIDIAQHVLDIDFSRNAFLQD